MSLTLTTPVTSGSFSRQLLETDGFTDWLVEYGNLDVILPFVGYLHAEGFQWSALVLWESFIAVGDHIDVRLDGEGTPNVIELNPLPGILPRPEQNSCFPKAARAAGLTYDDLVLTVADVACRRLGLENRGR